MAAFYRITLDIPADVKHVPGEHLRVPISHSIVIDGKEVTANGGGVVNVRVIRDADGDVIPDVNTAVGELIGMMSFAARVRGGQSE